MSKYTFSTYVESGSNIMAKKACLHIIEANGSGYNPLYIWGNHGVGKTHLLYAIQTEAKYRKKNVIFADGEWFVKDFVNRVRYGEMNKFRDKYRSADIILIDNIEKIIGKKYAQQEFFFTIESYINSAKQVVLTSSKPPKGLNYSDEKLKSRLVMGLVADIGNYSEYESRNIVMNIAKRNGKLIGEDLAHYILDKSDNNMARINQYFIDLEFSTEEITNKHIVQYMNKEIKNSPKVVDSETIIKVVSEYYKIDIYTLKSKSKNRTVVMIRQISMYLCTGMTNDTLNAIGVLFNRNHSTVKISINKITELLKFDPEIREDIKKLSNDIKLRIGFKNK
jgi:chromosomal replication initiator protein